MDIQKLKAKVEEILNKDQKIDPKVAERVNQIFNDVIAGMPPKTVAKEQEDPEVGLARRLKTQIDTVTANSDVSPELAKKLKEVFAAVEPELKKTSAGATGATGATGPSHPHT